MTSNIARILTVFPTASGIRAIVGVDDDWREIALSDQSSVRSGDIVRLSNEHPPTAEVVLRPLAPPDPDGDVIRWRRPGAPVSRLRRLRERQEVLVAIRDYFYREEFLELQSPLLVRGSCPDGAIESIRVADRYLVTSTEYQIKRMVTGGARRLFTLTQNFRAGEQSDRHNPEFTMLEWARVNESLEAIERDVEAFAGAALERLRPGATDIEFRGHRVVIRGASWQRLTVREALERHLGIVTDDFALESLRDAVARARVKVPEALLADAHDLLSYLIDMVGSQLGTSVPTWLGEWPATMTSSAGLTSSAAFADRSELFVGGMEVADGFPSLQNPQLQREFFSRENQRRRQNGQEEVELDQRYLAALDQGLPPGSGMALGIDRLVMVLAGVSDIREVLAFAWDEC